MEKKHVTDFINGEVKYDKFGGQYFWIKTGKNLGHQLLAELRGWGAIQNMFKDKSGNINETEAAKFQDEIGEWVADAINEKLNRKTAQSEADREIERLKASCQEQSKESDAIMFDKWKIQLLKEYRLKFDETDCKWLYWERSCGFGKSVNSAELYELFKQTLKG